MQLPSTAAETSAAFDELDEARKSEIITHLAATPDERSKQVVDQIIKNGGPEGRFVAAIFKTPGAPNSPQNKAAKIVDTE